MDPLSGAASVIAVIQLTGGIVQICGEYLNNVKNATQDVQRFQEKITALAQVLKSLDGLIRGSNGNKLTATQDLIDNIAKCSLALTSLKEKLNPETTQGRMRKWGLRAWKWPLARSEVDYAIEDLDRYKTTFALSLNVDQMRSMNLIHQKIDISRLQPAKGAAFNSYDNQHSECLPGTRKDLLQAINEWANSPHGKCIFWLNGMAGTGKSTISRTVASRLQNQKKLLGASFYFKRGEEDRGTAKKLFTTLTTQLVNSIPQMLPQVQNAIDDDPDISEKVLREQFEKLILCPLLAIEQREETLRKVIVIDALDECDSEDDIAIVLRLLPQVQRLTSVQLRFLLTSRPELPIRLGFKEITHTFQDFVLHEVDQPVIEHDISLYVIDQLFHLKQRLSLPLDWPGDTAIQKLVAKAVPLFIAAATLCRFIGDEKWDPQKRLETILTDQSIYVSKMDSTYIPVLKQLLAGQDETESRQLLKQFKEIVGMIVILATPLSIKSLCQLLDRDLDNVKCQLDQLHSVLSVPSDFDTPVRLLHLSFRDFLLDHRKDKSEFWIDDKFAHQRLTTRCLHIMQHSLRRNICDLPSEGTERKDISDDLIDSSIPDELKYACRYWAYHLLQCANFTDMIHKAFLFFQTQFLHWVEAMSLLRLTSEILGILTKLQTVGLGGGSSPYLEFFNDAKRFVLKNYQIADQAPLQIYCAGLVFAPRAGMVRRHFEQELPSWICQLPQVEEGWGAHLQTLDRDSDGVLSVTFSPNEQLLASGSFDGTVCLWDTTTGTLQQTLNGHSGWVRSVAFSPNGQLLACGSEDRTVCLWETATGILRQTLEGHSTFVRSIAFSPNGQLLASASYGTIHFWDITTGTLQQILGGNLSSVHSVSFSPNGQLLASGSYDRTVRLWDVAIGTLQQTLNGHSASVRSVAFSPNGQLLASGSEDRTVCLWDITTGTLQQIFKDHWDSVRSVAFSPNGQLLASGSEDRTVCLWDTTTGTLQQTLGGNSNKISSVAFSFNGQLLASGSYDGAVRLWDVTTGTSQQTLKGHSDSVHSVTFSPDGQLLASRSSGDSTVYLWDSTTGTLQQTLKGHSDSVRSVAFSPNGQLLASGSEDRTVRLWNAATGSLHQILESHLDNLIMLAFSPDCQFLAASSGDNTVRIWHIATGVLVASRIKGKMTGLSSSADTSNWNTDLSSLGVQLWFGNNDRPSSRTEAKVSVLGGQWVALQDKNCLWLPPEYRPTCVAVRNNTIALGHTSGRVSFLCFVIS